MAIFAFIMLLALVALLPALASGAIFWAALADARRFREGIQYRPARPAGRP